MLFSDFIYRYIYISEKTGIKFIMKMYRVEKIRSSEVDFILEILANVKHFEF